MQPSLSFSASVFQKKSEKTHSSQTQRGDSVQPPGLSHRWSHGGSAAGWRAGPVVFQARSEWNKHRNKTHRHWWHWHCWIREAVFKLIQMYDFILSSSFVQVGKHWKHFSSTCTNHTDLKCKRNLLISQSAAVMVVSPTQFQLHWSCKSNKIAVGSKLSSAKCCSRQIIQLHLHGHGGRLVGVSHTTASEHLLNHSLSEEKTTCNNSA